MRIEGWGCRIRDEARGLRMKIEGRGLRGAVWARAYTGAELLSLRSRLNGIAAGNETLFPCGLTHGIK